MVQEIDSDLPPEGEGDLAAEVKKLVVRTQEIEDIMSRVTQPRNRERLAAELEGINKALKNLNVAARRAQLAVVPKPKPVESLPLIEVTQDAVARAVVCQVENQKENPEFKIFLSWIQESAPRFNNSNGNKKSPNRITINRERLKHVLNFIKTKLKDIPHSEIARLAWLHLHVTKKHPHESTTIRLDTILANHGFRMSHDELHLLYELAMKAHRDPASISYTVSPAKPGGFARPQDGASYSYEHPPWIE